MILNKKILKIELVAIMNQKKTKYVKRKLKKSPMNDEIFANYAPIEISVEHVIILPIKMCEVSHFVVMNSLVLIFRKLTKDNNGR